MKNLYSKNEFMILREEGDMINEGIGGFFKKMWQGVMKLANKIKGSGEINKTYDKYEAEINKTFSNLMNIEASKIGGEKKQTTIEPNDEAQETDVQPTEKLERVVVRINEAEGEESIGGAIKARAKDEFGKAKNKVINKISGKGNEEEVEKTTNDSDISSLSNLSKEQIKNLTQQTRKRIEELKTQFVSEVNSTIERLSKNADYSSSKLKQFGRVTVNKLQGYIYDKWYAFYTELGDDKTILKITELKKKGEIEYKKSIEQLKSSLSEQESELEISPEGEYVYTNKDNETSNVKIIGSKKGVDEGGNDITGKEDSWQVETDKGAKFWATPSTLSKKEEVKKEGVAKEDIKVGDTFSYTPKGKKDPVLVKIIAGENGEPTFNELEDGDVLVATDKNYTARISKLKPTK